LVAPMGIKAPGFTKAILVVVVVVIISMQILNFFHFVICPKLIM